MEHTTSIRNDAEIQEYPSTLNDATVTFTLSTDKAPRTTVGYSIISVPRHCNY